MFFRDYYFSSGNSRVNRLIALFRCIVGLMKQIVILLLTADFFFLANSDYTSHFAAYDLGLHCLPMPLFGMLGIKWSNPLVTL